MKRPPEFQKALDLLDTDDIDGLLQHVIAGLSNVEPHVYSKTFLRPNHFYKYKGQLLMIKADNEFGENATFLNDDQVKAYPNFIGFSQDLEKVSFNAF